MNDKDERQASQKTDSHVDTPEGLGHDPLEWLQEDEEDCTTNTATDAELNIASQPVTAASEVAAETEEPAVPEFQSQEATPESVDSFAASASETPISASDNQSFTYDNHKANLILPEKLTVQIIEPLHSEWKTLLYDLPQSLEVDASKVKDVDAAGMQLFYALIQQMVFKGSDVVILKVQPSLKRHFDLFGLDDFFTQYIHAA